ncbi:MAG: phosphoribosyltransferase [Nitrospirae bacterium]|nr:MAG: phosphoribosyltransferase [Nitrospirota bacterium]
MLRDRDEAGRLLAERLGVYRRDPQALVLALPRGGVVVGAAISAALQLPLDVFLVRKLGAPGNPEYALGAVTETGTVYLNPEAREVLVRSAAPGDYLDRTIQAEQEEIVRRQVLYRSGKPLPDLSGRTVLLVDDGIATGATFLASIQALRSVGVKRLVAAIPVGPPETLREVGKLVDELVRLLAPEPFFAVGTRYENFIQVEDAQVLACLQRAAGASS